MGKFFKNIVAGIIAGGFLWGVAIMISAWSGWQLNLPTPVFIAFVVGGSLILISILGKVIIYLKQRQHRKEIANRHSKIKSTYRNERVYITELALGENIIQGKTFDHCEIIGPAIIGFGTTTIMNDCEADVPDSQFLIYATEAKRSSGLILLTDCIFKNCAFRRISVLVSPKQKNIVEQGITNEPM